MGPSVNRVFSDEFGHASLAGLSGESAGLSTHVHVVVKFR